MRSLEPTGGEDQWGSKICSADEDRGHGNQIPSENIGEGKKDRDMGEKITQSYSVSSKI